LRDANDSLQSRKDVCDQAKNCMRRLEVCPVMADLIVFNYNQSGDGCQKGNVVQCGVGICAFLLLLCGVSGLDNEYALDEEEERGGIEEL
jgi:hypothetical protein